MKYQGKINIENIKIGDIFYNINSKLFSEVINLTSSSVELFNKKFKKTGIDSKNWYDMSQFNRGFISKEDEIATKDFKINWQ